MKYLTTTILSTLLSLTSAAPAGTTTASVQGTSITRTSVPTTVPTGAPTGLPSGANILHPIARSQYEVWTGAVHYNTPTGKIFKNGKTTDVTTLLTFQMPTTNGVPQICEFHFYLDNTATVSGSGLFDVFDSIAPATQSTTGWPSGNLRDNYAGRMKVTKPGEAVFQDGYGPDARAFPCPDAGLYGAELVGVYDVDDIEWTGAVAGAYIKYYPAY
jgi:hypothetical protein